MKRFLSTTLSTLGLFLILSSMAFADAWSEAEHGYADNNGVQIHYATMGEGPLVVMIHGFPDFWYSWRHQMEGLSENFKVVAIDQRGYNRSGQPEGQANYGMQYLVGDVAAVIRHLGEDSATIVGHDWAQYWAFLLACTLTRHLADRRWVVPVARQPRLRSGKMPIQVAATRVAIHTDR